MRRRLTDGCAERAETFSMESLALRYLDIYAEAQALKPRRRR